MAVNHGEGMTRTEFTEEKEEEHGADFIRRRRIKPMFSSVLSVLP
ncbi:MAG: hypothetical protein Q7J98_00005 [Kiritimatiellia bacterium]|nr:hypothetical protein [Kiritimatiellia bacterium]